VDSEIVVCSRETSEDWGKTERERDGWGRIIYSLTSSLAFISAE